MGLVRQTCRCLTLTQHVTLPDAPHLLKLQTRSCAQFLHAVRCRRVVNQLIRYGRVIKPGLGLALMHASHSRQLLGAQPGAAK
jgi:hypothetical protein